MDVFHYQVTNVIKMYVRNMKRMLSKRSAGGAEVEDLVLISEEGIKRMLFERIQESITVRSRKHDP
jgi:hypothetical protein